jgi:hypothetical protein
VHKTRIQNPLDLRTAAAFSSDDATKRDSRVQTSERLGDCQVPPSLLPFSHPTHNCFCVWMVHAPQKPRGTELRHDRRHRHRPAAPPGDAATGAYTWRDAHAQACGWVTHGTSSPGRGGTPVATDTHTGRGCNHVAHTSSAAHPDALNQKFDGKGSRHVDDTNGSQLTGAAPRARLGARSAAANAMAAKQRAKLRAIVWGVRVRVHEASIVRPCEFVRSPCAQHRAVPLWCSCIFQAVRMDRCMHAMCRLLTTWLGFAVLALAGATNPFPSLFIECARIAAHPRSC